MPTTERLCPDYRQKYRNLKRKLKILIYENECFQEELKKAQRKLLKVARDKSFLLDRLLQFEVVESSTSDSEATVSSDSETELKAEVLAIKKKKTTVNVEKEESTNVSAGPSTATTDSKKKKSRKPPAVKPAMQPSVPMSTMMIDPIAVPHVDGHMTSEEIERHLESKQALRDLMPEKTPLTVPVELFSNDPGLECDLNGQINESSPNIVEGVSEDDGLIIDLHD